MCDKEAMLRCAEDLIPYAVVVHLYGGIGSGRHVRLEGIPVFPLLLRLRSEQSQDECVVCVGVDAIEKRLRI